MLTMFKILISIFGVIPDDGRCGVYYEQEDIWIYFCGFFMVE